MATRIRNITKKVRSTVATEIIEHRGLHLLLTGVLSEFHLMDVYDSKLSLMRIANRHARRKAKHLKWLEENRKGALNV